MKLLVVLFFVGAIGFAVVTQATDYCSKSFCNNAKHIDCNNTGNFAKTCPPDRKMVDITPAIKDAIVKKHNQLRNTLASGSLTGFKPCTRMATIQWDEELSRLASLNVKTCVFAHDACHNTVNFTQSGQNLAETMTNGNFSSDVLQTILPLIDSWWSENKNTTMEDIKSYPQNASHVIGHFTVMARDANTRVGCACSTFKDSPIKGWKSFLFACNYATTNIINYQIYTIGTTASQCKTGVNSNFKALCSVKEQYKL